MFCRGWRNRAPGRFEESGDHNQETAKEKNGQGATRFHGPNLHRPLETMTFKNLCGTEECSEAFLLTRPAYSSSGLGDLHSPNLAEICVLFPSFVPAGPLSFQRMSSVGRRIDHLSDPSQSRRLHDTYRQI